MEVVRISDFHDQRQARFEALLIRTFYILKFHLLEHTRIMSTEQPEAGPSSPKTGEGSGKKPVVVLCIGMAGSVSLYSPPSS